MYIGESELEAISVARDFISSAMQSADDRFCDENKHIAKKLAEMEAKAIKEIRSRIRKKKEEAQI